MHLVRGSALSMMLWAAGGLAVAAYGAEGAAVPKDGGAIKVGHFDPQGQPPSTFTLELRDGLKATLPFADKRDFDEARKGFIAAPSYKQIMADAGNVAWDMASYQWLLSGQDFASIHPSLQRQAVLNMEFGLYAAPGAARAAVRAAGRQHADPPGVTT